MLTIRDLSVEIRRGDRTVRPVTGVDLTLHRGETLGIVGETGSGKSMTGLAVMGMLPAGSAVTSGSIDFDGTELIGLGAADYRALRGNDISMVFQDSMTSLNPTRSIGDQVAEPLRLHRTMSRRDARARAEEMLALVGIPHPRERMGDFPHQLSGGMRQRVMIAMALICEPRVLIADEPTTALDVTIQAEILELLGGLKDQLGMAMILVTHDMGVVARHADRVGVMYGGRLVETGTTADIFRHTRHQYTHALLSSIPSLAQDRDLELFSIPGSPPDPASPQVGCRFAPRCPAATERCRVETPVSTSGPGEGHTFTCWNPAQETAVTITSRRFREPDPEAASSISAPPRLQVVDLRKEHPVSARGLFGRKRSVKAVAGVSFEVRAGEAFGLVGESGCGKSTLGRMLVALDRPTSGQVLLDGASISGLRSRQLGPRRAKLQMMFQDSHASLDPKMRIDDILREPLAIQGIGTAAARKEHVTALLTSVGLGASILERYPHELSGGQRQRIGLARALALDPDVLVADEPVSALDVSIRSQVLNLMRTIQLDRGLSSVVISHDLAVVRYLVDRVGVMYLGALVEVGETAEVYSRPAHPYTAGLLAAVPVADPDADAPAERVRGELPSPLDPPSGCRFRTRCPLATALCATVEPTLEAVGADHDVACHFPLQPKTRPTGVATEEPVLS
ncbi:ABC transporter ATP-binding protein [Microbacterium sp. MYb62]|uniref:ABC transporter ATP-binding protein n=1 Tax=Microbacterium sp. MYb62 TaxID=1848690 RepID=UPI000CFDAF79|nr:ABC transporter ATP-binding protein [Microbacterium sp. MYb62]PRB15946.1 dipeptide ABC transporter ATP-binding protein [Microbacterium sp. MYb62]